LQILYSQKQNLFSVLHGFPTVGRGTYAEKLVFSDEAIFPVCDYKCI
jgi:hypothetical protein